MLLIHLLHQQPLGAEHLPSNLYGHMVTHSTGMLALSQCAVQEYQHRFLYNVQFNTFQSGFGASCGSSDILAEKHR